MKVFKSILNAIAWFVIIPIQSLVVCFLVSKEENEDGSWDKFWEKKNRKEMKRPKKRGKK